MHHPDRPAKLALSLLMTGLLWLTSEAAPAPLARHSRRSPCLPPVCTMHWNGTAYATTFGPDGSYTAQADGGALWTGTWRLDGRTLTVRETPSYDVISEITWSFELDARLRRSGELLSLEDAP